MKIRKVMVTLSFLGLGLTMNVGATNTDISQIDNVIYIEPFTATVGTQTVLSLKMKNTADIRGFQFDLYLPEGITPVTNGSGRIIGSLNPGRLDVDDEHTLTVSTQDDGGIRFLCGSLYNENFLGTDGEVASIGINIANDMEIGDYPIILRTMRLQESDISKFYDTNYLETIVTISLPADTRTVLDELSTVAPASATGVDVRVLRTIKANEWSTIVLPFSMTAAQVKEAFGSDVQLGDFTGTETTFDDDDNVVGVTASFEEVGAIEANHPYIIKVSAPVTEFTVDGVDINADEDEACVEFDNGKSGSRRVVYSGFYGTYHAGTVLDEFTLFLSDNKFWYSAGSTKMKAFRAYFDFLDILTEVEEGASARIAISFGDGEATGINAIDHSPLGIGHFFDLQGRPVVKPGKGIYVKEGKKVVVK